MEIIKNVAERLLTIKSIVTLLLSVLFFVLAIRSEISGEQFLTIFATVIAFYFGTQHEKREKTE